MAVFARARVEGMAITNVASYLCAGVYPKTLKWTSAQVTSHAAPHFTHPLPMRPSAHHKKVLSLMHHQPAPYSQMPRHRMAHFSWETTAQHIYNHRCTFRLASRNQRTPGMSCGYRHFIHNRSQALHMDRGLWKIPKAPSTTSTAEGMYVTTHKVHMCSQVSNA